MRLPFRFPLALAWTVLASAQTSTPVRADLETLLPRLETLYQDLHRHPELSNRETRTASRMAEVLGEGGYEVARVGGGVVGVLRNGPGPVVLLRTELDALPVEERTGLAYASEAKGVMHACGHDAHMAVWAGTAWLLARHRDRWRGTVLMVGQPAEELGEGAQAMLKDGLLTRFPRPGFAIALHDSPDLPAGSVAYVAGYTMAAVNSGSLTLFGRGGHGARPEAAVDPVVLAARTVLALQTLVSREKDPLEPAVLTVGAINGGTKTNVIPDQVTLLMTVRSYDPKVQARLLAGIARVAKGEALAAGSPREPLLDLGETLPATWNDPDFTRRLAARLATELGADKVAPGRPDMVSEDFGAFGTAAGIPSALLRFGTVDPARYQAAKAAGTPLPSLHAPEFAPAMPGTLRTGVLALTFSALEALGRP
ncbi:amidohydrolase [Mesoterricola silvestris]|uniref:Amidohydrolase n=1 Tax=Mesoterricola silvestris TaxID=2927979 RepID=A0AA48GMZ7_9BACT|nr:amidohydrolase [Mesoterricola silvestris]BDU72505.1 putative amidohydrolase [Mesoterricola silvestris]